MEASETAIRTGAFSLIALARRRANISQRELARRAGTSPSAVSRYEQAAATPDLSTLIRLVRACGFDLQLNLVPIDSQDLTLIRSTLEDAPEVRAGANRALTEAAATATAHRPIH